MWARSIEHSIYGIYNLNEIALLFALESNRNSTTRCLLAVAEYCGRILHEVIGNNV